MVVYVSALWFHPVERDTTSDAALIVGAVSVVPSNVSALPLVATLLPLRYRTPLAVPPLSVRSLDSVAVVNAPVVGVVAPTVPLILIDAVPVRFVTVPLDGVPSHDSRRHDKRTRRPGVYTECGGNIGA